MKTPYLFLVVTLVLSVSARLVEIPDPELQKAVRNALGKPVGDITVEDIECLTVLDASRELRSDSPIKSFQGIEAAKNLSSLNLGSRLILRSPRIGADDLSPLRSLSRLTTLDLDSNGLTNVSFLEDLTNLTTLDVRRNELTDFSFLERTTSLTTLDLRGNQLTSLSLPESLTGLTALYLDRNPLTDFSFLEELTSLTSLHLHDNRLTSLKLPNSLTSLTTLRLSNNGLTTLRLPEGLTSLTELDLMNNPIATLNVPVGLNIDDLELTGFEKSSVTFYIPLTVERALDKIEISWSQGNLQSMNAIGGTWSHIPHATNPYHVDPKGPQRFFRAILE